MRLGLSPWLAVPIVAVAYGALHIQTSVAKTLGSVAFGGAAGFLFVDTGSLLSPLTLGLIVAGANLFKSDGPLKKDFTVQNRDIPSHVRFVVQSFGFQKFTGRRISWPALIAANR
jgi:hypothetical protein